MDMWPDWSARMTAPGPTVTPPTIVVRNLLSTLAQVLPDVRGAEQVALDAVGQHRVAGVHDAEEAADIVHDGHRVELHRLAVQLEERTRFSPAMKTLPAAGRIEYRLMKRGFGTRSNQDCQVLPPSVVMKIRL